MSYKDWIGNERTCDGFQSGFLASFAGIFAFFGMLFKTRQYDEYLEQVEIHQSGDCPNGNNCVWYKILV